jgi:hypothetical protein
MYVFESHVGRRYSGLLHLCKQGTSNLRGVVPGSDRVTSDGVLDSAARRTEQGPGAFKSGYAGEPNEIAAGDLQVGVRADGRSRKPRQGTVR